ncbi:MAG: hypothetical protein A4E31_00896 [Methanomassiliicoccales archaeon PtaU1.Bin030]|nr:MAG: hypothetical protein A4E31_00896 [Methanomassiliicoccales archaeon PtaU1.Bin030]
MANRRLSVNKLRSSIASLPLLRSIIRNAEKVRTATARRLTMGRDPHPQSSPRVRATSNAASPAPKVIAPGMSKGLVGASFFGSRSFHSARAMTTAPMGMLTQNMDCQPNAPVRKPPRGGPRLSPMYTDMAFIPSALPLSCGGKAAVMMAADVAVMNAAPHPCRALKAIIWLPLLAMLHRKEPRTKMPKPTMKMGFLP